MYIFFIYWIFFINLPPLALNLCPRVLSSPTVRKRICASTFFYYLIILYTSTRSPVYPVLQGEKFQPTPTLSYRPSSPSNILVNINVDFNLISVLNVFFSLESTVIIYIYPSASLNAYSKTKLSRQMKLLELKRWIRCDHCYL